MVLRGSVRASLRLNLCVSLHFRGYAAFLEPQQCAGQITSWGGGAGGTSGRLQQRDSDGAFGTRHALMCADIRAQVEGKKDRLWRKRDRDWSEESLVSSILIEHIVTDNR